MKLRVYSLPNGVVYNRPYYDGMIQEVFVTKMDDGSFAIEEYHDDIAKFSTYKHNEQLAAEVATQWISSRNGKRFK